MRSVEFSIGFAHSHIYQRGIYKHGIQRNRRVEDDGETTRYVIILTVAPIRLWLTIKIHREEINS